MLIHAATGDARRLLLARIVLDEKLSARDPLQLGDDRHQQVLAERLLAKEPVSWADACGIAEA